MAQLNVMDMMECIGSNYIKYINLDVQRNLQVKNGFFKKMDNNS